MKKLITIGDLSFRFDQRARGQETPYWVGVVLDQTGAQVGTFSNNGRGGATLVHPRALEQRLCAMVDATKQPGADALFERYDLVLQCAEVIGYMRGCANVTLDDYVRMVLMQRDPRARRAGRAS